MEYFKQFYFNLNVGGRGQQDTDFFREFSREMKTANKGSEPSKQKRVREKRASD